MKVINKIREHLAYGNEDAIDLVVSMLEGIKITELTDIQTSMIRTLFMADRSDYVTELKVECTRFCDCNGEVIRDQNHGEVHGVAFIMSDNVVRYADYNIAFKYPNVNDYPLFEEYWGCKFVD